MKIMVIWSYHSWQIDGETVETVTDFTLGGSKITADGEHSHEVKWQKKTNLNSILKSRHITLPTKVHLVKAMAFSLVMYGCESLTLTIKKPEHQRIDAFELWCWRRLLRVPWTVRRSHLSILKETSHEYSLEALILKLKLPILWPPDAKNLLTGKDPDSGKDQWQEKVTILTEMVRWHH